MECKAAKQQRGAQVNTNRNKQLKRQTADFDVSDEETSDEPGSNKTAERSSAKVKLRGTRNCVINLKKDELISGRSGQHSKESRSITHNRLRANEGKSSPSKPLGYISGSKRSESKTSSISDDSDDSSERGSSAQSKKKARQSRKGSSRELQRLIADVEDAGLSSPIDSRRRESRRSDAQKSAVDRSTSNSNEKQMTTNTSNKKDEVLRASSPKIPSSNSCKIDSDSVAKQPGSLQKCNAGAKVAAPKSKNSDSKSVSTANDENVQSEVDADSDSSDSDCVVLLELKNKMNSRPAHSSIDGRSKNKPQRVIGTITNVKNIKTVSVSAGSHAKCEKPLSTVSISSPSLSKIMPREESQLSRNQTQLLVHKVFELETAIAELKKELISKEAEINKLKQLSSKRPDEAAQDKPSSKDTDEVTRLKNQLIWKDEQIDELSRAVEKNLELEAQINRMLSSKQAYEEEVIKSSEDQEKREAVESNSSTSSSSEEEEEDMNVGMKKTRRKRRQRKDKDRKKKEKHSDADDIEKLFTAQLLDLEIPEQIVKTKAKVNENEAVETKSNVLPVQATAQVNKPQVVVIDDVDDKETKDKDAMQKGRHEIRQLSGKLQEETKLAGRLEAERRERVKKQRDKHLVVSEIDPVTNQPVCRRLVLAMKDGESKEALVEVDDHLLQRLKPHQVEAVEFMWDSVVESLEQLQSKDPKTGQGSGCILAHCMGLGKTLSMVTIIHTLLSSPVVGFKSCLVLAPINAVLNWVNEWGKWLKKSNKIKIYEVTSLKDATERIDVLLKWKKKGGVLVMGYQLFRLLVSYTGKSKKLKEAHETCLVDPGPDLIVCDEGHILKNDATALSRCVNKVRTKRRIVLTGTPLQNNLIEYHCMVSFVKPNLLGNRREFMNRFVNPITNGQHTDSTAYDVRLMKRRAHVLHEMLSGCVQRRDYSALVKFLPPKHEYVISVRLSSVQIDLYQQYLAKFISRAQSNSSTEGPSSGSGKLQGVRLFADYQGLMRIWTHPWVLKLEEKRQDRKPLTLSDDDELESIMYTSSSENESDTTEGSNKQDTSDDVTSTDTPIRRSQRSQKRDASEVNGTQEGLQSEKSAESNGKATAQATAPAVKAVNSRKRKAKQPEPSSSSTDEEMDRKNREKEARRNTVKVLGGEVIRQWQTKSRNKGGDLSCEINYNFHREEQWWEKMVKDEDKTRLELSGKLVLLFEILALSEHIGDKVLVFSQSLLSLDLIEDFLALKSEQAVEHNSTVGEEGPKLSTWIKDEDYVRMDGSTGVQSRRKFTDNFNEVSNERLRLFLISTKAGGLGINLDTANRVIIFDASWNPSHDVQSIFRVYRFGQQKPVFIYRFLAQGTMEEKIYERQVTKETLSQRVVDEHQIDRHFSSADLQELYNFKPDRLDDPDAPIRPVPAVPKDMILAELLSSSVFNKWIVQYHEHDSLLENRPDENLSEEERRAAWDEYEREKSGGFTLPPIQNWSSISQLQNLAATFGPNFRVAIPNSLLRPGNANLATGSRFVGPGASYLRLPNMQSVMYSVRPNSKSAGSSVLRPIVLGSTGPVKPSYIRLAHLGVKTNLSQADLDGAVDYAFNQIPVHFRDRFSFQLQQLPKVMLEIFRFNPEISADNLKKRLAAFLGMHTRTLENASKVTTTTSPST